MMSYTRTTCLFLVASAFTMVAACQHQSGHKHVHEVKSITIHQSDSGSHFKLIKNQFLTVNLNSNPSTGYSWSLANTPTRLAQQGMMTFSSKTKAGMVGVGGIETWQFKALKSGQETLTLIYSRPWEKDVQPIQTVNFIVDIR